ncbi:MAG: hypothetical protein WCP32_17025, partial [Bacteroidota bacterium]
GKLGYIIPADAPLPLKNDPSDFQSRAMEMAQIDIYAKRIQSKHALFIFDACFAGTIFSKNRDGPPEYISHNTEKDVRQFNTSGSADETVADASFFCDQFIEALDRKPDFDNDGYLTGSELGFFLRKEVIRFSNNRQHPQSGKINDAWLDDGDFVFVVNPVLKPLQIEETPVVQYGAIELLTEISGSLYVDSEFVRTVSANNLYIIKDVSAGSHFLKITGNENWEGAATIETNRTVTIDVKQKAQKEFIEMVFVKGGTFQMGSNDA